MASRRKTPAKRSGQKNSARAATACPSRTGQIVLTDAQLTSALQRFVERLPNLRAVLAETGGSANELLLRNEIRRTIQQLSTTFYEVSEAEPRGTRAAMFLAASMVAAKLADGAMGRTYREH